MDAEDAIDSLWFHTAPAKPRMQRLNDSTAVEVAIVGAGITGLCAALHLAEAGVRVAVLEADEIGSGASGRNGGFVVPHFARGDPDQVIETLGTTGERLVALVGNSASALFSLIERLGIDCDAIQGGWYQAAHSASALRLLERRAAQWQKYGQIVTWHDADETSHLTGTHGYRGSWGNRSGGTLHPLKFVYGLAAAAIDRGAQIFEKSPVVSMARSATRWRLETAGGGLVADQILVCTNALSWQLIPRLASAVTPATIYQVATEPIPVEARRHLLGAGQAFSDTRINLFTYRFDADWRLITGAVPGGLFSTEKKLATQMSSRLRDMLGLPFAPRIDYLWSGRASVGPQFLPAVYEVDTGVIASAGCNGRGVALGAEIGRVMADAARSGAWRDLPLPFRHLGSMRANPWKRWGVRWYPVYGAVRDRLEQFAGS